MSLPAAALAPALVILAARPESKAAAAGAAARQARGAELDLLEEQAAQVMRSAAAEALAHLTIVVRNNPKRSLGQILARPDVRQAMTFPFEQADVVLKGLAQAAFEKGSAAGKNQAVKELTDLKVPHSVGGETSTKALQIAQRDINRNTRRAPVLLRSAMVRAQNGGKDPLDGLRTALGDLERRARYSVAAAGKSGWAAAKEDTYGTAGPGIGKRWVTHFIPTTCGFCAAKHGTVIPLGQAFDAPDTYQWYGPLYAPPAHPNCGCELVPWPLPG